MQEAGKALRCIARRMQETSPRVISRGILPEKDVVYSIILMEPSDIIVRDKQYD